MASSAKSTDVLIINCDETYPLDSVQALVTKSSQATSIKTTIERRSFSLPKLSEVSEEVKGKPLLCAILVLNAHESRLSINEKNAGIGYAILYRALREAANGRVLVVIGGDEKSSAADTKVVSNWVRYKVASQFEDEYLNGRRGFVFSWGKSFYPVHEEAFQQYLRAIEKGKDGLDKPFTPPVRPLPEPTNQRKTEKKMATQEVREKNHESAPKASNSANVMPEQSQGIYPKSDNKDMASKSTHPTLSTSSAGSDIQAGQPNKKPNNGTEGKSSSAAQVQYPPMHSKQGHHRQLGPEDVKMEQEIRRRLNGHLAEVQRRYPGYRGKLLGVLRYGQLDERYIYPLDDKDPTFSVPKYIKETLHDDNRGNPERDVIIYEDSTSSGGLSFLYVPLPPAPKSSGILSYLPKAPWKK